MNKDSLGAIGASIVLYQSDEEEVKDAVFKCLACPLIKTVSLIDNSPQSSSWEWLAHPQIEYVFNNENKGYGSGHNVALRNNIYKYEYSLVINADVIAEPESIDDLVKVLNAQQDIGMIAPKVLYPDGSLQHSVKLLPTPLDLIMRRFVLMGGLFPILIKISPDAIADRIEKYRDTILESHKNEYELGVSGYNYKMHVHYISGCFMLMRNEVLKKIGLFDERYFMYPEDIDLSRRIAAESTVLFWPDVSIIHGFGRASYSNKSLMVKHMTSMMKYFNKWGWFFDPIRRKENKKLMNFIEANEKED